MIRSTLKGLTALAKLSSGNIIAGDLPRKVAAIINEWCETHRIELMNNWEKASQFEPLDRIQGADRD